LKSISSASLNFQGLPFPLYLDSYSKALLVLLMSATLIWGTKLRLKIVAFLLSPESKAGSINILIWYSKGRARFLWYLEVPRKLS
jgi:hypothetical protein